MKVIITDEAYSVLEDALDFLIKKLEIPVEKAIEIGDDLIDTAENIKEFPFRRQLSNHHHLNEDIQSILKF